MTMASRCSTGVPKRPLPAFSRRISGTFSLSIRVVASPSIEFTGRQKAPHHTCSNLAWRHQAMKTVITGGAGFIGCNVAAHALRAGDQVVILDNLARPGAPANARWLSTLGGDLSVIHADVRDYQAVRAAVREAEAVYHLAAQVAVTTSVIDPRSDFEINALGTLNVLEAVRAECP